MEEYMERTCKHCPFRNDITPYLHPKRAAEIAYATQNPYNSFPCHKTTEYDDDSEDGTMLITEDSKECAGFLTMRAQAGEHIPDGFIKRSVKPIHRFLAWMGCKRLTLIKNILTNSIRRSLTD